LVARVPFAEIALDTRAEPSSRRMPNRPSVQSHRNRSFVGLEIVRRDAEPQPVEEIGTRAEGQREGAELYGNAVFICREWRKELGRPCNATIAERLLDLGLGKRVKLCGGVLAKLLHTIEGLIVRETSEQENLEHTVDASIFCQGRRLFRGRHLAE